MSIYIRLFMTASSVCIPRMDSSVSRSYIYQKLVELNIGTIQRIIEIPLRNDPTQKRVIIKLQWDPVSQYAVQIQNMLKSIGSIKLVHNMPWYWKIVATHPKI